MSMRGAAVSSTMIAAVSLFGCLPQDTRPVPGSVYLTVEPSAAAAGVSTPDGWTITFERILLGLGDISLEGEGCTRYANTRYERVFDMRVPGRQKVGQVFGLGACDLNVRLRSPSSDALLGQGVTTNDRDFLRTRGLDPKGEQSRISVYVRGQASRGQEKKRFEWTFRRNYSLLDCREGQDGKTTSALVIRGNDALELRLSIHVEELFRVSAEEGAALGFDTLASADENGDQEIGLDELAKIPARELGAGALGDAGMGDAIMVDAGSIEPLTVSLADQLYQTLVPRMVRLEGASCKAEERSFGR